MLEICTWDPVIQKLCQLDATKNNLRGPTGTLAWKIPWTEERGRLKSTGSWRVRHDWATSLHFTSLVAQMVKHLPTMQKTWVKSLGWEYLLEKEMATHSSTLAWKIPWTEEPGRLQSMGSQRVGHDWVTSLSLPPVTHASVEVTELWAMSEHQYEDQ